MVDLKQITLAILAGGEGSRMGFPKAQLEIADQPILEYLLRRFAWPGPTLLVTAPGREHPKGYELFDREAVDPVAGQGPLRGVLTALENAAAKVCVVATVDMPEVSIEQLNWGINHLQERSELRGVMMRRITDGKPQIEPFPLACRTDAAAVIAQRLTEGRRSVHSLADLPGFAVEDVPAHWSQSVWTNLNRPEDLKHY
jgi:molybdopterin-guanine dinucleotide biosynthesis protein A